MNQLVHIRAKNVTSDTMHVFDLEDILPDHRLLINISASIVSLLSKDESRQVPIVTQRSLTDMEVRMLIPLMLFASCCPQEVLQVCYHCTYEVLVQSLLHPDENSSVQWKKMIQEHRLRLQQANQHGIQREEMRGVYNALFGLRQKLEPFGFTIRSRRSGYYLSSLSNNLIYFREYKK